MKVPHAFLMRVSTLTAIWLVRIMSNNLPDVGYVDLDYNAVIDLHLATEHFGISRNPYWLEQLLTSRVASNPWECLSRAWNPPEVNTVLAEEIISLIPSYHFIQSFGETIGFATAQVDPDDVDFSVAKLATCPFPITVTHQFHGGQMAINAAPLIAFALAAKTIQDNCPLLHGMASQGCQSSSDMLLQSIAIEFDRSWYRLQRLAQSACWMTPYTSA